MGSKKPIFFGLSNPLVSSATFTWAMAFMMKKKRYKFQVDLCLDELAEVSYSKAILFVKVRQLDGGNFTDVSER